jgi:hypothetical protein
LRAKHSGDNQGSGPDSRVRLSPRDRVSRTSLTYKIYYYGQKRKWTKKD